MYETSMIRLLPTLTLAQIINDLLREMQKRGDHVLDYENADMYLDRIEYHSADGTHGIGMTDPGAGDRSDNLYCFFKAV